MMKEQSKSLPKSSSSQGKEQTSVSSKPEFELEALEEETASILQKFGGRSSRSRSGDYNNVDGSRQLGGSTRCGNATKRHSTRTLKKYSKRRNGSNKRLLHSSSSSSFVTEGGIYHPHAMMAHSSAIKIQSIVRGHLSRRCSTRHDNDDNDNHSQHQLNAHHDAYLSLHEAKRYESKTRLFGNDGRATSHLKNTISNAFKTRRFDSIPAILAHESYGTATTLHEKMGDQNEKLDPNYEKYQHSSGMHDSFEYLAFDPRYSATSLLRNDCAAETADIGNHCKAPLSTTQERKGNNNTNTSKRSPKNSNHGAEKRLTRKEASGDDINIRDIRYPGSMNCASRSIGNDAGIAGTGIDVYDKHGYDDRGKNKGTSSNDNPTTSAPPKAICFNCWSAKRGDTCQLIHQNASTSDTLSRDNNIKDINKDAVVPFCESWGLDNVRQMYRSEDIGADHDVDLLDKPADEAGGNHDNHTKTLVTNSMYRNPHSSTRLSSLRFAKDQRRHSALPEHNFQHPLFASLTKLVMTVNYRARRNLHVRQWFKSLVDCVKNSYFDQQYGEYNMNSQGIAKGYGSREERYWIYHYLERRQGYSNSHIVGIPNATINRYDYYDSISRGMRDRDTRKYSNRVKLFTESIQNELPQPFVTGSLYEDPNADDAEDPGMCYEKNVLESNGKVVLRKFIEPKPIPVPSKLYEPRTRLPPPPVKIEMGRHVDTFGMEDRTKEASSEKELENASEIDVITYGTFGKNAAPDNLSAGELSSTVILSQTIQTSFDPPYTGFSVIDSKVYSPERTPESFVPTYINDVDAPCLEYIDRPLKHSLEDRGMPTIMIRTADGEDDPRDPKRVNGFRTTEYVDRPKLNSHLDTNKFVPAESIVTLNTPQVLPTTPAWIDVDYPFCETESRDTHIEDLSHIAKFERKFTPNKPQFFTVLSKQHPGKFMKHCDSSQPLGRLETTVTRSWSLTRKRRIAMFHTDDGEPYYYDRRTGKTFWERPLICDEELMPIVEGGVILGDRRNAFIGNDDAFGNAIDARSNMRKMILSQYETEDDRIERDRAERSSRPLEGAHSRKQQSSGNARKSGNGTNSACRKFPWRTKLCNKKEGTHENSNPGRKSKHAMKSVSTRTGENDFFEDITARRVGQQFVDYIDSEPQIPRGKPVGRVKPRSAGKDWLAIGFDPWSAGKDLLTIEFIPKLTQSTSQLDDSNHGNDDLFHDSLRSLTDFSGGPPSLSHQRQDKSERKNIAMFDKIARCIRHGNFPEMDTLMNEASWKVPIDYTDDVGNTLLIICCQHGNKRMVKLCLRKGCDMNKQNCNGHTCLHYAFGYGFDALGEYLISKGANDDITNSDGLTCYEGLRMEDVSAI